MLTTRSLGAPSSAVGFMVAYHPSCQPPSVAVMLPWRLSRQSPTRPPNSTACWQFPSSSPPSASTFKLQRNVRAMTGITLSSHEIIQLTTQKTCQFH